MTTTGLLIRSSVLSLLLLGHGTGAAGAGRPFPLERTDRLELRAVKADIVEYRGRRALKLTETSPASETALALLKGVTLRDGTIELEVSGSPAAGAVEGARGFVGVAFRVGTDAGRFEYIYIRPTNGRAEDQVRRNHSVQYASHPEYPWPRLRKESPEKYETYADLEVGAWTKMRIVISGGTAKLHLHGAVQPSLVVNDLKLGPGEGGIALWIGPGTEGHFANLTITSTD